MTLYTGCAVLRATGDGRACVRVEVVAVGSELLLGQIADTNSQWLGEQLAAADGSRATSTSTSATTTSASSWRCAPRSRAPTRVIVCGGLGPTQDDITRAALAEVMNVELERDEAIVEAIRAMFASRGRDDARQQPAPGRRPARRDGDRPGAAAPRPG